MPNPVENPMQTHDEGLMIGDVAVGNGAPLALISGLNVLERRSDAIECARENGLHLPMIKSILMWLSVT